MPSLKRIYGISLTLVAIWILLLALQATRNRLGDESTLTGWTLLVSTAGLYLLTLRKKLIRHRLGPVAVWLQMHVYLGSFASVAFLTHIGWPIRGWFELSLAFCFVVVAGSGVVLGYLSRTVPKRLAAIPQDYMLERIPMHQLAVAESVHSVAMESAQLGEGATLAEYYQRRLIPFFRKPRSPLYTAFPNGIQRRRLLRELNDLDRYLAEQGIARRQELTTLVCSKDDLDFHYAQQSRLRLMFAVHVALTWALALLVGVHVVLVYRFQGAIL